MYCPRCGETNEEPARFCSACGLDLTTYQRLWTETEAQAPGQGPQTHQDGGAYPGPQAHQAPQYRPVVSYGAVPHVPNYLGWAIVVLVLFFWPTGIPAVVYASQVDNKLARGDIGGAQESSRKAKMWCWITFGIGVVMFVLILVALGMGAIDSRNL